MDMSLIVFPNYLLAINILSKSGFWGPTTTGGASGTGVEVEATMFIVSHNKGIDSICKMCIPFTNDRLLLEWSWFEGNDLVVDEEDNDV